MTSTTLVADANAPDSIPRAGWELWLQRAGYGLLLGALIGLLEFAYYRQLVSVPGGLGLGLLASLLLPFCGEGVLLALTVCLFERWRAPRPLRAPWLALAVVVASTAGVLAWQSFMQFVLRERLGLRLLRDYVGQPVDLASVSLYHVWLMLVFGGLAAALYLSQQRHARMLAVLRAAEIEREVSQRKLAEARLAALQTRLDPEFVFQTLTKLEHLYEADPQGADSLLEDLIVFLRGAIAESRPPETAALA